MNENGNKFYLSGFRPADLNLYVHDSLGGLPEEVDSCIKMAIIDNEPGEKMHAWMWITGESINGIHVRILKSKSDKDPQMSVFIPWMASAVDIYLAYSFMNAVKNRHSGVIVSGCNPDGSYVGEEVTITDEDRDEAIMDRFDIIDMLLDTPEQSVSVPCMAGQCELDLDAIRESTADLEWTEQILTVLFAIVKYTWSMDGEIGNEGQITS